MAAAAMDIGERAKWDAYDARVAKMPKRDRRNLSAASPQTKWVIEAMRTWYGFYFERLAALGLPSKNTLHDAALLIPRAPLGNIMPMMPEPPSLAVAVENELPKIMESRRRVLIAYERYGDFGVDRVARELKMRTKETSRYLDEARQSMADLLRGAGWKVPHKDER